MLPRCVHRGSCIWQIRIETTRSWGTDPLADGAFSEIAPGQVAAVMQWSAARLGQVHFAGEQTVLDAPGMEAAVVSGDRAAKAILG